MHDSTTAVEPSMSHNYRCLNDQGGTGEKDSAYHRKRDIRGSAGPCAGKGADGASLQWSKKELS